MMGSPLVVAWRPWPALSRAVLPMTDMLAAASRRRPTAALCSLTLSLKRVEEEASVFLKWTLARALPAALPP